MLLNVNFYPGEQFQNGKAEKCIGDVWIMTKVALLFSNVPRIVWDEAWLNAGAVKRHLLSAANEGFKSPLHMITENKVSLSHILPFGSLLYIALDKEQIRTVFGVLNLIQELKLQYILDMVFMKC